MQDSNTRSPKFGLWMVALLVAIAVMTTSLGEWAGARKARGTLLPLMDLSANIVVECYGDPVPVPGGFVQIVYVGLEKTDDTRRAVIHEVTLPRRFVLVKRGDLEAALVPVGSP